MNTVKPSADSAAAKTDTPAEGKLAFSSLLQSLAGGEKQSDSPEETLPKELLSKIENMLSALDELSGEELTEAQQQLVADLMQLIDLQPLQPERKEGTILVDLNGMRKFTQADPDAVTQAMPQEIQEKLAELLKKLSGSLPETSATDTKKFDAGSSLMGVEGKLSALDAEKIEKITAKLSDIIDSLEKNGKNLSAAAAQPEQAAKLAAVIPAESEKPLKAAEAADEPEMVKAQMSAAVVTAGRSDGGQQQETSQQDDNRQSQVQSTTATDSVKSAAAPAQTNQPVQARPEVQPLPAPVVRMNNLTEELGDVFKNSLRMSTNGESTQIKVNITPDHLGHLDIRLTETNGKIAAQIFTSSLAAKDALDLQLNGLRNTLLQQGLNVEKIEVVQNNSQQSLGQQHAQAEQRFAQQQRQNNTSREQNGYQQIEEKSAAERSRFDAGTMKVDYTV